MAFEFNPHRNLSGMHAFMSASSYHWLNDTDEKFLDRFANYEAAAKGTELHAFAEQAIKLGMKLSGASTIAMYVNDAIGFGMTPEQILYYSPNCFGTADTILYKKNVLRIHDLKTGKSPASVKQLEIYAALFCLEYHVDPDQIRFELRIYQNGEKLIHEPTGEMIREVMDKIMHFDKLIMEKKREEI